MSTWPLALGDLGWAWPLALTFQCAVHWGKLMFGVDTININEIWPNMSILPWPCVTVDDLGLWTWTFNVRFIETKLMALFGIYIIDICWNNGKCRFDLDFACGSLWQNYLLLLGVDAINIHWNMVKMVIWVWLWVTLDGLNLWPWLSRPGVLSQS